MRWGISRTLVKMVPVTKNLLSCDLCDYTCKSKPTMVKHKDTTHRVKVTTKRTVKNKKNDMEVDVVNKKDETFHEKIKELEDKVVSQGQKIVSQGQKIKELEERGSELDGLVAASGQVIETMEVEKHHMLETIDSMVDNQKKQEEMIYARMHYSVVCTNCNQQIRPGPGLLDHKCGEHSGTAPKVPHVVDSEKEKEETHKTEEELIEVTKVADKAKNKEIIEGKKWDCDQCDYQGSSESTLRNHMEHKHKFECFACHEGFDSFGDLMVHRKANHKVKACRFLTNCKFGDKCHYKHPETDAQKEEEDWQCNSKDCGTWFNTKKEMMEHRKANHSTQVCRYYLNGNCTKGPECWYRHQPQQPSSQRIPNREKDFPALPTAGRSPEVGNMTMQQTLLKMMQEHQANMTKLMAMM